MAFFRQPWLFGLARPDLCADLQEYLARTLTKNRLQSKIGMRVLPRLIHWIFWGSGHACRGCVASAKEGVAGVKLRVKRQRLLLRAFRKPHELLAVKNRTRQRKPTNIVAFSTVRNESLGLPTFLAHYRQLEVRHFFFVSNNSTDSTNDYLAPSQMHRSGSVPIVTSCSGSGWIGSLG